MNPELQQHSVRSSQAGRSTLSFNIFSLASRLALSAMLAVPGTLLLFSGSFQTASAQLTSGTILGSVQDTTGALIPGAKVTATASAIGSTRTVTTGSGGTFSLPNLPAGTYSITVSMPGFQTLSKSGVILDSATNLNAGVFALQNGEQSTSITVTADSGQQQIQAQSGERSDLITGKQLDNIALNGRNVLDMLRVIPGISGVGSFGASNTGGLDSYSVNGTRTNQHDFVVDGSSNVDSGNNGGTQVTINPDAIGEVKVLTSNFQAAYGKAGGGSIVVTSRGGTNDIHGNLHFFHRNEGMNANDTISDQNHTPQQLYRYNTAGATIGGPIKKDKLFFFVSTEFFRQLVPGAIIQYRTPTDLERAGNFSKSVDSNGNPLQIYNPSTHVQFTNNTIVPSTLTASQQAVFNNIQKILALYPEPNVTSVNNTYNRQDPTSFTHPRAEYIGRIDYQITPGERLFARYINNRDTQTGPVGSFGLQCLGTLLIPGGCSNNQPGWNLSVDLTSTLSPSLVNEVTVGPSVYTSKVAGVNGNITVGANNINLPLLYPVSGDTSIPDLGFSGNGQSYPYTYFGSTPWHQATTNITVNDNLTWSLRSHTMKFGAFYERARKDQISYGNSNGQFSFDACSTSSTGCVSGSSSSNQGSPFASALLGNFQTFDQSSSRPTGYFRYNQVEFYAQDTWQVTPHFTLDYGVRFVYIPPQYDARNQIALFTPSAYNPANAVKIDTNGNVIPGSGNPLDGMTYANNGTLPKGGWNSTGIMPEPRIGFAWDPYGDSKSVIRGGFGTSHDREQGNLIFNTVFGNPSLVQTPSISNSTITNIATTPTAAAGVLSGIYGADRSGQVPVTYSYSLGIQREVGAGTTLDIAYVGNVGRHLVTARDINTIPYGTTFTRAAQNPANFAGGVVPLVEPNLPQEYVNAGYSFSGSKAYPQNYLSPYKGYGQMEYYKFDGTSNYNSLQVSVQRRYNKSLTYGGFYTWSKTLTTSTADESFVDPFNPRKYSYGVAGFDRKHVAAINYVLTLPNFSNMLHAHWASLITDGFQLSGIASIQSGTPVRNSLYSPANQLTGGSQYSKTPPTWVGLDAAGNLLLPKIGEPTTGAPGSIRQGGLVTWDQSIYKDFHLGKADNGRYIQLRGEFFNILNHPNISGRDYGANLTLPSYNPANGSTPASYTPLSITKDANFGKATSAFGPSGPGGPRVIQLAAKIYF